MKFQQRVRRRTQRSSSLGPLLDEHKVVSGLARSNKANTNSLESIDSNPRQAVPKGDQVRQLTECPGILNN